METCPPELACGGASCQEPCAAAAADRRSSGCEFYLQPPRFSKAFTQSCYAAYIVNVSSQEVDLALELEGSSLDLSRALFKSSSDGGQLVPLSGPILPGEHAILFVSDRDPSVPLSFGPFSNQYAPCPLGVVPASYVDVVPDGTGVGSSFRLSAKTPVAVSTMYPFGGAPSVVPTATLLLPVTTWAKEHVVINAWEGYFDPYYRAWPASQIMAAEDDTEITIFPTRDIQNGPGVVGTAARVPVTYRLNKGQHLQLVQYDELSGSQVASNKPTAMIGGHTCSQMPTGRGPCDIMAQQIPPFEQWGSEYVGVGYRPRMGGENEVMPYRIVAARDGTQLDYDPAIPAGAPTIMSAGEVVTFVSRDPFVVRTQDVEHPVYLAAYMSGSIARSGDDMLGDIDFGGRGDPEFVNVVPTGQYLNAYSFYADPSYGDSSLVIVRGKIQGEFKDVWVECAGSLPEFKPVGTRGDYEYARVDLSVRGRPGDTFGASTCRPGVQRMHSEGPFGATIWGWDTYASYAYPGGMALRKLVTQPLVPLR
ncbi:MAG: hypothetical protein BGO98_21540 [Myxococcales bacterium 68-20]|nr:MAG: hypothetical protein BGO98_21540 [Myxococcales bacterium 68-20]